MKFFSILFLLGASPGLSTNLLDNIESLRWRFYTHCPDESVLAASFLDGLTAAAEDHAAPIIEAVSRTHGCVGAVVYMQFLMETFQIPFEAVDLSESRFWVFIDVTVLFLSQLATTPFVTEQYLPYARSDEFMWGLGDVVTRLAEIGSVPLIGEYNKIIQVIAELSKDHPRTSVLPSGLVALLDLMHALNGAILKGRPVSTLWELAAGTRLFIESTRDSLREYTDIITAVHRIDISRNPVSDAAIRAAHFALPAVYFSTLNNVGSDQFRWLLPHLQILTDPRASDPQWGDALMVSLEQMWASALDHATEYS